MRILQFCKESLFKNFLTNGKFVTSSQKEYKSKLSSILLDIKPYDYKKLFTRTVIIIVTYALLKEIFSARGIIKNLALTTALNFTLATLVVILLSPVIVSSSGFLFFRKFNKPTNFKVGVWRLRTSNKYEFNKALVKIKRKLTVKEFETFEVLAKTFEGTIEELIIVVKEIESK